MVDPGLFREESDRNLCNAGSENWWLRVVATDKDTCNQNGNASTPPFPLS